MPYLQFYNKKIFYNITGKGSPLLLLHNGFYSTATWDGIREQFAKHFMVIDYDRYGYGKSRFSGETTDTGTHADIVEAGVLELSEVIKALNLDTVKIVGHCIGGAISFLYAVRNPGKVKKLVPVSVGYYGDETSILKTGLTFRSFDDLNPIVKSLVISGSW